MILVVFFSMCFFQESLEGGFQERKNIGIPPGLGPCFNVRSMDFGSDSPLISWHCKP